METATSKAYKAERPTAAKAVAKKAAVKTAVVKSAANKNALAKKGPAPKAARKAPVGKTTKSTKTTKGAPALPAASGTSLEAASPKRPRGRPAKAPSESRPAKAQAERETFFREFSFVDGPEDLKGSQSAVLARIEARCNALARPSRPWPVTQMGSLPAAASPLRFEPKATAETGAMFADVAAYIPPEGIAEKLLQLGASRSTAAATGRYSIVGGMHLTDEAALRPWNMRPLIGQDLNRLQLRYKVRPSEFASCFGFAAISPYLRIANSRAVLAPSLEMLARIYDAFPWPPIWLQHSLQDVFEELYGPVIAKARSDRERSFTRTACYHRFTVALDRASASAYRWIEKEGRPRTVIALLLRKLMQQDNARLTLESLARQVIFLRGGDFDVRAPAPTKFDAATVRRGRAPRLDTHSADDLLGLDDADSLFESAVAA